MPLLIIPDCTRIYNNKMDIHTPKPACDVIEIVLLRFFAGIIIVNCLHQNISVFVRNFSMFNFIALSG